MTKARTIGVISDTHGLLRPQVLTELKDSELIIHAGDIGSPDVLDSLKSIAPVYAVRGNNDRDPWAQHIPWFEMVDVESLRLFVLHEITHLPIDPIAENIRVVIYGHSHKPRTEYQEKVLYLNPGSAGPRRFKLPVAVARLYVREDELEHEIVELSV